ncbi:MAG: mandelate racemase/muconate lactonizing enzyme family protein [Gammaproteobacteria bacterium]
MKVIKLEVFPINIPYTHKEVSYLVSRAGVSDVIVKLTADNGLVGWGESCMNCETEGIVAAVKAAAPFVLGRDPWDKDAIARDFYIGGGWQFQPMTGNFAFAGIDMALWDLCGKECGQPLYRLFGGALREQVDYFYYLQWGGAEEVAAQCQDGVARGYSAFYFKVGVNAKAEGALLEVIRYSIGAERKIRIDANQAWTVPQAAKILNEWHSAFDLDFVEAPVRIEPIENMLDLQRRVSVPLCANEGLWREADAARIIRSRAADYLCFSSYWVGTLGRFHSLIHAAAREGLEVCKHTHGEFGLAATAGQHLMLNAPNSGCGGHQQTAQMMADDILTEALPIATGPRWGRIDKPGLGVEVDEDKLMKYHEAFLRDGEFTPYGERFR